MNIAFEALDTLFFRDGKPFSLGDENWADGLFPPTPSVIYGALRTWIASVKGIPFEEVESSLGNIQITGICTNIKSQAYFPLPADLAIDKDKDEATLRREKRDKKYSGIVPLLPQANSVISSISPFSLKYTFLPPANKYVESVANGLIFSTDLIRYLERGTVPQSIVVLSDYLSNEPKVGNGRDAAIRSVKEGSLFRVGMKRPKNLSFLVQFNDLENFKPEGTSIVKLGAEGKLAHIDSIDRFPALPSFQITGHYFKLYLATPAIFTANHWYPNLKKFGINAQLVGACMGKPQPIGGFSMNDGNGKPKPKPMYKAIPAGSVFFFYSEDDPAKINALQGKSISDEREKEGFGICYVGNFNPDKSV